MTELDLNNLSPTGLTPADATAFIDSDLEAVGMPFVAFVAEGAGGYTVFLHGVLEVNGVLLL